MPSASNASARKSTAQAANAMISEGGAIAQPSKEESEATLDHVTEKRQRKSRNWSEGLSEGDGHV